MLGLMLYDTHVLDLMLYGTHNVLDMIRYVVLDLMHDVTHDVSDLMLYGTHDVLDLMLYVI